MRKIFVLIIVASGSFINNLSYSQFYETGQDPALLKWSQINTDNFQIIFPQNFSSEAQRLANIFEYSYSCCSKTLNCYPKKVPVILHNQTSTSNALTIWAPKRMEFFTTPPQDIYPHDWLEQLVLHEYRHVIQTEKMNQGITKMFSWLFGEQAPGAVVGMLPRWFLEGDAIVLETALSNSGRGRLPSFEMELRALTLERDKIYNYDKALLGSYKDYIPNSYRLGYPMVAYARKKYGYQLWDFTLNYVARKPYTLYPFYFGLKSYTGISRKTLYNQTFNYLDSLWTIQAEELNYTRINILNKRKSKHYTSFRYPRFWNDSTIIVEKSGIDQIDEFISVDMSGNETRLITPGYNSLVNLSVSKDLLVWNENVPHHRWGNQNYSVIKTYNFRTKEEKTISSKSRYFAPAIKKDGLEIVAVEISPLNEYFLVILDSRTGKVLEKIPSQNNHLLLTPSWSSDGNSVFTITLSDNGKSIKSFDINTKIWTTILEPTFEDISNPVNIGDNIYFNATFSGIDNIYVINKTTHNIFQVTSSRYGAFDASISPDGNSMVYSDYSQRGYNLVETEIISEQWKPLHQVNNNSAKLYSELVKQEEKVLQVKDIPETDYDVKPYSKLGNLFNFHSWTPFYYDYENLTFKNPEIYPGVTFISQNKLSTAFTYMGYAFEDGDHHFKPKFIYKGWYPVFEIQADYGGTPQVYTGSNTSTYPVLSKDKLRLYGRTYLPINLTNNRFVKAFIPSIEFDYYNFYLFSENLQQYTRGLTLIKYRLYFYNYLKTSLRDINPKWGLFFDIEYSDTPFEDENFGTIFKMGARLFTRGILNHHSIKLIGETRKQNPERYLFGGNLEFPRGYNKLFAGDNLSVLCEEMQTFSSEYTMPLLYPDFRIGSLIYLTRFRTKLFFDYATGSKIREIDLADNSIIDFIESKNYYSYGAELYGDFFLSRMPLFPISAGIRYSYVPERNTSQIEFLLEINLSRY